MFDKINEIDYKDLIYLVEKETGVKLEVSSMGRNIYFRSENSEVDMMIRENYYIDCKQIVLARLFLEKRGSGIGTKVLNWIENYATSKNINRLVIESVESLAMSNLALKLNYTEDKSQGIFFDEGKDRFFAGNYVKII